MPYLYCRANIPYSFHTSDSLVEIVINHRTYNVKAGNEFTITFDEDTVINDIDFYFNGIYFKSGILDIWENIKTGTQLLYLIPNKYSNYSFKVEKGMRLNVPEQSDHYYLGYFKNNVLASETLAEKNRDGYYFRFWDSYDLKFKAAEVPLIMVVGKEPEIEKLKINDIIVGNAYYCEKGDILKTDIWLDEGDVVDFENRYQYLELDRMLFATDNSNWAELDHTPYVIYVPNKSGFLQMKCLKQTVINVIDIERTKSWNFELNKDEIRVINFFKGDKIEYSSRSRYYVNNELKEGDISYTREIPEDGSVEFKGSIVKNNILVKVLKRKGY